MLTGEKAARQRLPVRVEDFGLTEEQLCELFDVTPDELQWGIVRLDEHGDPIENDPVRLRGLAGLADFERFTRSVPTVNGPLTRLDPAQRLILLPYFLGYAEIYTLIPKGNGKTSLLALLQVYHLLTVEHPEISVGAALVRQAEKIYAETSRVANLPTKRAIAAGTATGKDRVPWKAPRPGGSPVLVDLKTLPGFLKIRVGERDEDGVLKVLASDKLDKGTLEGSGNTLGVCEELHAHINDAIIASIQGGLHKRGGQLFAISTAGKWLDSILGHIRASFRAESIIRKVAEFGRLTVYRRGHDSIMFEWALEEGDDVEDLDLVKTVNPASFVSREGLRRLRNSPSMTLSRWKRNHCGIWTSEAEGWLEGREAWDANNTDKLDDADPLHGLRLKDGDEIYLGVDPAWSYDSFAIIALKVTGDRQAYTQRIEILRPARGKTVSHRQIKTALLDAMRKYRVLAMGYDRNRGFAHIVEELSDEHGLNCVAISMAAETWVPLTAELRSAIDAGWWTHSGDELYTGHVLAGETKNTASGERLHGNTSRKVDGQTVSGNRVDGLMATGVAWVAAFGVDLGISIYQLRGGGL